MKRLTVFLALLLTWAVASGAGTTANLTWTAPATYTNGVVMPLHDIAYYTIQYTDTVSGASFTTQAPATATTATLTLLCSSWTIQISATTTTTAIYPNAVSGESNAVTYSTGVQCVPSAPTNLKVS